MQEACATKLVNVTICLKVRARKNINLTYWRIIDSLCIYNSPVCVSVHIARSCDVIDYLCNEYLNVCILGDFNFPIIQKCVTEYSSSPAAIIIIEDTLLHNFLSQFVGFSSRGNNYLDFIFCN